MKQFLFILFLILQSSAWGQLDLAPDTVYFTERTGGDIDTFDIANSLLPTTFDGGVMRSGRNGFDVNRLFQEYTGYRLHQRTGIDPLRYSSLPHLGFSYSFGSQGTQFLHLSYTQAFKPNFLLNLTYDRKTGAGFLRNSNFTGDNVRLRLQRMGQRYSTSFKGSFQSYEVFHPGGIDEDPLVNADSVIRNFGLEFVGVNRDGVSATKMASAIWNNYLNFTNDSLNHFGLMTRHEYGINYRYYEEGDGNSKLPDYTLNNYDTTKTKDSWNNPSIENGAGVYFLNRTTNFYIDGTINYKYWNSWDIRDLRDTSEIGLKSNLSFEWRGIQLENVLDFNLIGGFNGWSETARAKYERKKFSVSGGIQLQSIPADALQRFYYANNYEYKLNTINRQVWTRINGQVSYIVKDSLLKVGANVRHFSIPSAYTFDGSQWQLTDSLGSASSLGLNAHLSLGAFNLVPEVILSTDRHGYIPAFQVYSRLYFKGRLFEAKKLEATIGVDASYHSGFQLRSYIPSIDAFYWGNSSAGSNPGMTNLHFFATMGISQFRFFVRFENIGYFWNDRTIREAVGYPIAGTRFRVGLTWDFFN